MEPLARLLLPYTPRLAVVVFVLGVVVAAFASGHAVLYKREPRSTAAWFVFIWMLPIIGALFYALLGINRIRRRASALGVRAGVSVRTPAAPAAPAAAARGELEHDPLARLVDRLGVTAPLVPGNEVTLLDGGDTAFARMLAAIEEAKQSVALGTYIFDSDDAGVLFRDALARARGRGVEVRVLIDAVGTRYHRPRSDRFLRAAGIPVARFLPPRIGLALPTMNLRNHRKVMVIDGRRAFTGGMNIRVGNLLARAPAHPIRDIHCEVSGPVVAELMACFADDWAFTTGERLQGEAWFPTLALQGGVTARALVDGPDRESDLIRHTLLGALAVAEEHVQILTPYFVPDPGLITALNIAALRGVRVEIVIPAKGNLPLVQWASTALLWQVLERGCRVWLSPPPFDHGKLMVVDGKVTLLGSANWDARSLRLNFELNLLCHSPALAVRAAALIDARRSTAREITLAEVDARALPVRLRDGFAKMFAPIL